jgi:hypothetical protein
VMARRTAAGVGGRAPASTRSAAVTAVSTAARAASQVPGPISVIVSDAKRPALAEMAVGMRLSGAASPGCGNR